MLDGYRLMIPGPIQLRPEVLAEMSRPMVPHYGADWTAYYNETVALLARIFMTNGRIFPIPGSGSAGLDAAIGSVLGDDDRLLVLSNGFFGERIAEIARSHDPRTVVCKVPAGERVTPAVLERALAENDEITAVAMVHSESSSGLLNPVRELVAACRARRLLTIVDAISSLGGAELRMDEWGIDVCVSASQKCLEGPPGIGLVAVGADAWARIADLETRGWYLNLQTWAEYAEAWADWHPFPVTLAVPAFRALRCGVEGILEEGLEARWQRHREMARWAYERLAPHGYEPVFPDDVASPTILALRPPSGLTVEQILESLKEDHRILVAGGMGAFKGRAFRVGNMGPQATEEELSPLIEALREIASRGKELR